jgi:nicotinate-nucleotide adenylyltransferase
VVELAGLLVTARPGWPLPSLEEVEATLRLPPGVKLRLQVIDSPQFHIASRDLRRRATEHRSLRYLVPSAVEAYIHDKHLYETNADK